MTLHSLTGTRIYFSSLQHRRLNGIIIEREFLMALDDLIKCRRDLALAASRYDGRVLLVALAFKTRARPGVSLT